MTENYTKFFLNPSTLKLAYIYILISDSWFPELTALTVPLMKRYAARIAIAMLKIKEMNIKV